MRIEKYPKSAIGRVFQHNNRQAGDGVFHSNEAIDDARTHLNYYFVQNPAQKVGQEMEKYYHQDRENLIAFCELRLSLPQDVKASDEKKFFEAAYNFMCDDWGKECVIDAVVHKDETTPHMHLDFIPTLPILEKDLTEEMLSRIKKYEEEHHINVERRICAKDSVNRQYLQKLHPRMLEVMTKTLGYPCEILNGATDNGNKTIQQLKNQTLSLELEKKQQQLQVYSQRINILTDQIRKSGFDTKYFSYAEVFDKLLHTTRENQKLKILLTDSGIAIPKEIITSSVQQAGFRDSHFNVVESFGENSVRVLETYRKKPRVMPDWKLIESIPELEWIINNNPQEICQFDKYLIFPTDSIEDTVSNLIWIKKHENEFKDIAFTKISNDEYNLAESILRQCQFETEYKLLIDSERNIGKQKEI